MMDLTNHDRRVTVKRDDGSTLSYSIPAGVTDEAAAAEVARMERLIERGYTMKCNPDGPLGGGLRTDMRWFARRPRLLTLWLYGAVVPSRAIPRAIQRAYFWLKCRCLDVYWFFKDRRSPEAPGSE